MSNEKTRAEKIKLLNDLSRGKITLDRAFPPGLEMWYEDDNGLFSNYESEKSITLEALRSRNSRKHVLILIRQPGNDPIIDDG